MKKVTLSSIAVLVLLLGVTGCYEEVASSDKVIAAKQERAMEEMTRQTGIPAIKNFQEKKMMKMLYEIRDQENLICYAYLMNQMDGTIGQFLGKCIGYGLPASTQYSNPDKLVRRRMGNPNGTGTMFTGTMPQAEPNGLFMPEGLSATWLMMIDPKTNKPRAVYIEPLIIVSPFPLH